MTKEKQTKKEKLEKLLKKRDKVLAKIKIVLESMADQQDL